MHRDIEEIVRYTVDYVSDESSDIINSGCREAYNAGYAKGRATVDVVTKYIPDPTEYQKGWDAAVAYMKASFHSYEQRIKEL
jgi:hypothetical protein